MENNVFLCEQASEIDLVDYLSALDFQPQKIRGKDYWHLSPLRQEKEALFKVNIRLNLWYDYGVGKGGDVIDFGVLYHGLTIPEILKLLQQNNLSFHLHFVPLEQPFDAREKEEIKVVDEREIVSQKLIGYVIEKRKISLDIARQFCREVDFILYEKKHTAIGFKNSAGGYELRNKYFKGSSSPKDVTLIENNDSKKCLVFEGFFDLLSFQMLTEKGKKQFLQLSKEQTNFLVLNSISFFERAEKLMEKPEQIHLYLDRTNAGLQAIQKALKLSTKYFNKSHGYKHSKDLNDYLKRRPYNEGFKPSHRFKMRF